MVAPDQGQRGRRRGRTRLRSAPVPGTGGCGRVARKYQPLEACVVEQWVGHMTELTGSEYWSREEDLSSTDDAALASEGRR